MIILVLLVPIPSQIFNGQMMILTRMMRYTDVNLNVLVILLLMTLVSILLENNCMLLVNLVKMTYLVFIVNYYA